MLPAAGVPIVPYTPDCPQAHEMEQLGIVLLPPIHAHSVVEGLNSQRSFRLPNKPVES
jgi:hypothetical protein